MTDDRRSGKLRVAAYGGAALVAVAILLAVTSGALPAVLRLALPDSSASPRPIAVTPSEVPRAPPDPVRAEVTAGGVTVELELSQGVMPLGERLWATVRIRNENAEPVIWYSDGCAYPAYVWTFVDVPPQRPGRNWNAAAAEFKEQALLGGLLPQAEPEQVGFVPEDRVDRHGDFGCTLGLLTHQLEPGGELEYRAAWDASAVRAVPVPPGIYRVTAVFGHAGVVSQAQEAGREELNPFRVEAEIDLTVKRGAREIRLSPGEAVDVALANPQFAQQVGAAFAQGSFCCGTSVRFVNGVYEVSVGRVTRGPTIQTAVVTIDPASGEVAGFRVVED